MGERRRVRLRRIGGVQVVRIPAGFELPVDAAVLRREGERLVIEPVRERDLVALLASMEPIEEAWPEIEDAVPEGGVALTPGDGLGECNLVLDPGAMPKRDCT